MSSSSSRSSSESNSSPAPTKKRRKVESPDSSDDHDTSDASSDDADTRQPLTPPEGTVLSHAERRRQKKKQKQEQRIAASSESTRKKRKLDDGTADASPSSIIRAKASAMDDPRRQLRQNSVWVGNLAFRTPQDALRGFFDGVGEITRIHMPMRRGKQTQSENMGFAYVDFETPEAKVIAITLSEGQLDGRNLLIKDGNDFTGRPAKAKTDTLDADGGGDGEKPIKMTDGKGLSKTAQKILRTQKQPPALTLFLGNLGFETTEESIRELFEAHRYWGRKDRAEEHKAEDEDGKSKSKDVWIRKIRMGTFEDSGTCKGFAFVDFTTVEHATAGLINPRNHRLNGRDLVVEYASPEAVRRGGGPRNAKGLEDRKRRNGPTKTLQKDTADAPYTMKYRRHIEQEDDAGVATEATTATRSMQSGQPGHDRRYTRRAKPGAALALAQRQSAAILPSQGQKIVF